MVSMETTTNHLIKLHYLASFEYLMREVTINSEFSLLGLSKTRYDNDGAGVGLIFYTHHAFAAICVPPITAMLVCLWSDL